MNVDILQPALRGERVCDRCTTKKTKCSRQKPACSRCIENGWACTYSVQKKKPGPPKGSRSRVQRTSLQESRRASHTSPGGVTPSFEERGQGFGGQDFDQQLSISIPTETGQRNSSPTRRFSWTSSDIIDRHGPNSPDSQPDRISLSHQAERDLLHVFLDNVQPHYPLFQAPQLLQQYNAGQLSRGIVCALSAVSVALSTNTEVAVIGARRVAASYIAVVRDACSPILISDVQATVDDLRMLFLLALYEFRHLPNRRAWTSIGHLVRLCYHYGIHQVDNPTNCAFYERDSTSPRELESWRYLWWSTYILDCCCNTTVATPSIIDLDSLCTAFPAGTIKDWTQGNEIKQTGRRFLSKDIEEMSDAIRQLTLSWRDNTIENQEVDINFVVRITNTSHLRSVCDLRRAILANPAGRFDRRWRMMSAQLAALRLALPTRYLDPQRRISAGEQKENHALRLVTLLEIDISNLMLSMPRTVALIGEDAWLASWEASIEVVDRIVDVVMQWDPLMCSLADPCIAYIVFIAMCMLHINANLQSGQTRPSDTEETSRNSWQLSKLFLQQLGNQWFVPKALAAAAEKFRDAATYPITLANASEMLTRMQKPLNFQIKLEEAAYATKADHYVQSSSFSEIFEPEGFTDWLAIFGQSEEAFMGVEADGGLNVI